MVSAGPMVAKNLLSNVKCSVDANDKKAIIIVTALNVVIKYKWRNTTKLQRYATVTLLNERV